VWVSWRLDETDIKGKGEWRYLSRAVDKYGKTIDFGVFCITPNEEQREINARLTAAIEHLEGSMDTSMTRMDHYMARRCQINSP
jgi:DDE domain